MAVATAQPRRLVRAGTVRSATRGCTEIAVSVPCSTCRLGCGRAGSGARVLQLGGRPPSVIGLHPGDTVQVSVDGSALNRLCAWLFGPVLAWLLLAALVPEGTMPPLVQALIIAAGLVGSLLLGHVVVRSRTGSLPATLDLRVVRPPIE